MELRKIARVIGVELRTIQYHLLKKIKEYKELYNQFIELMRDKISYLVRKTKAHSKF